MTDEQTHHTVIIGAGFAGLSVANELDKRHRRLKRRSKITLIDKRVGQVYYPLLYEVATGELAPRPDALQIDELEKGVVLPFPVAARVLDSERTMLQRGTVVDVRTDEKEVVTKDGTEIPYDSLVMAVGAKTATYGIPGVEEHAYALKSLQDAMEIRERLDGLLDKYHDGHEKRCEVVVVGAGPTGSEFIAELANSIQRWGDEGLVEQKDFELHLVEAGPNILSAYDDKFRRIALRRLKALGITIHTDTRVTEVKEGSVSLKNSYDSQEMPADLVVWATGIAPIDLPKETGMPVDKRGFVKVKDTLQVDDLDGVFALGDCASFYFGKDDQNRVPALAQAATKAAGIVAENIARGYERRALTKWHPPTNWMTVVPLGGKYAIADLGKMKVTGWLGYVFRKFADLAYFVSVLRLSDALRVWVTGAKAFIRND